MVILRFTRKLLRRLPAGQQEAQHKSTTVLGDWYANVLYLRPQQLILAVSERSLLSILVPASPIQSLVSRWRGELAHHLEVIGIPTDAVKGETAAMNEVVIAPTQSRSVLGAMNDLRYMLEGHIDYHPDATLRARQAYLATNIMSPIGHRDPYTVTRELFGLGRGNA